MSTERALAIIKSLANGVNPVDGAVLTANHFINDADVAHALHHAVGALSAQVDRAEVIDEGADT